MSTSQTQTLQDTYTSSIQLVRGKAQQLEKDLVVPSVDKGRELGRTYPVSATFITIFALLSFIPVLSFAAFIAFWTVSALFMATGIVFSFVIGAVIFGAFFFVPTVLFTLGLAIFSTGTLLSAYLAYRFWVALTTAPTLPLALSQLKADFLTLISNELSVAQSTLGSSRFSRPSSRPTLDASAEKINGLKEEVIERADALLDGKKVLELDGHESGEESTKHVGEGQPTMVGVQAAGEF